MKRLLILLVLLPLVGWGQEHRVFIHTEKVYTEELTYTDGFGYELVEHKGGFKFVVQLDFAVPIIWDLKYFPYRNVQFQFNGGKSTFDGSYRLVRSELVTDRRCFTHEDAWAIRNMAWELVHGCDLHRRWEKIIDGDGKIKIMIYDYCPYCGKKLDVIVVQRRGAND